MDNLYAFTVVLQFAFATLLPVCAAGVLTKWSDKPWLSNMSYAGKQTLFGIIFGLIAVFGTEFGINTHDATMNVRDAAPIVAGLYFGGPAGIIAGLIGGIERWFSVLWGRGAFTQVACSVATVAAGVYAAALSKFLFEDRKPSWPLAFTIGVVAEVLHLLLVFVTNPEESARAFHVVQVCAFPMIFCNGISVALSGAVIARASGLRLLHANKERDISQAIQLGMLGVVLVGFVASVAFTYNLQQRVAYSDTIQTLSTSMGDVEQDINDASNAHLLQLTKEAAKAIPSTADATQEKLEQLVKELNVSEVHVIDSTGHIVCSSDPYYLGFDMNSGEQSREFLDLLPGGSATTYVQAYQPMTIDSNEWRKFAGATLEDGFIQVSYDSSRFAEDLSSQVQEAVKNRHVGNEGLFVVLSEDGKLMGIRADQDVSDINTTALLTTTDANDPDTMFQTSIHGVPYYATYKDAEGFRIIALLPEEEAIMERDLSVYIASFMEVVVFAALFAAIYVLIKNVVVKSIWEVNGTLGRITSGDLEAEVDVRDSTEFASLSDDINKTVASLREAIAAESARIESDLETAKAIQVSALPRKFPPFPDIQSFDLYASMNAAREVGGDFYDFFLVDDHTLGFLIADVSGKGIPASLFMMAAKSELANYMKSGMELANAVQSANWNLCQNNDADMFVTVWAALLDYDSGELTYCNAGHNPPLLRHNGTWEWLKKRCGVSLGMFESAKYRSETIYLVEGDELFLYTDGVNEAFSINLEEFGNDRLEQFLNTYNDLHPHVLIDSVRSCLKRWSKGTEQSDDITMLCLEYGEPPEISGSITTKATKEGMNEVFRRMHYEFSRLDCPEHIQNQIDLVFEELFTNICDHGYDDGQTGEVQVAYVYNSKPSSLTVSVTDWGRPFDPVAYGGPKDGEGDEVTGMGIRLVMGNADEVAYVRDIDQNVVVFTKAW